MERRDNVVYLDEKKVPIRVYMPWHKGWLGAITIINGTTTFHLDRKHTREFITSQEKLGYHVVVHWLKRGQKVPA